MWAKISTFHTSSLQINNVKPAYLVFDAFDCDGFGAHFLWIQSLSRSSSETMGFTEYYSCAQSGHLLSASLICWWPIKLRKEPPLGEKKPVPTSVKGQSLYETEDIPRDIDELTRFRIIGRITKFPKSMAPRLKCSLFIVLLTVSRTFPVCA